MRDWGLLSTILIAAVMWVQVQQWSDDYQVDGYAHDVKR